MELTNDFEVKAPIEEAWAKLTNLELIAPAMPGAQLEEVEGEEYRGTVKVKVGPITAKYKGTAKIVEKDDAAKMVLIDAKGRDTRGQGNANAMITAQLTAAGDDATKVELITDLTLTGKVAQFARGVLADVSTKLIGQFVDNLESDVFADGGGDPDSGGDSDSTPTSEASAASASDEDSGRSTAAKSSAAATSTEKKPASGKDATADTTEPASTAKPTSTAKPASEAEPAGAAAASSPTRSASSADVRKINSPEAEAVDLLDATGAPLAKRVLPALGLLAIVLLIIRILRNRSSD